MIGDRNTSPLTGILRIIPIERMNALLVISPNPAYLEEAKKWIERLDARQRRGRALLRLQPAEPARRARRRRCCSRRSRAARRSRRRAAPTRRARHAGRARSSRRRRSRRSRRSRRTPGGPRCQRRPQRQARRPAPRARRTGGRRRSRHRAQHPGRRGQGPEHAADRRDAGRVLDHRAGAEEARRAVAAGDDRGDDRRSQAHRPAHFGVDWLFKGGAPSGRGSGGLFVQQPAVQSRRVPLPTSATGAVASGLASRRKASATSSTTRTSRAACRRR